MRPIRSAELTMDIRPYRVGLLERLARHPAIDHVVYSGVAAPGMGAPENRPSVAVPVREVRNHFWPRNPIKVLWQGGTMRLLRSDCDVIVCQEVVSNLSVWAIRLLHKRFGKALVLIGFFYRPDRRARFEWLRSMLRRFLRRTAGSLVAYTERGRDQLLTEGVDPQEIFVTGNTLDTSRLIQIADSVGAEEVLALREKLEIEDGTAVVVFLGRLRTIKRVDVALEAVTRVAQDQRCVLLVVGDGEEREALESASHPSVTRFLGPIYDETEVARVFAAASLLVVPGWVGLTCVHGFCSGLPCLTTSSAAIPQSPEFDYIRHGRNGLVIPDTDPEAFANAISSLLGDETELQRLGDGARETARALDMDKMAAAFVSAVSHAVGPETVAGES